MTPIRSLTVLPLLCSLPFTALAGDGELDAGFGTAGVVLEDLGVGEVDYGNAVTVQADGKIVVAGTVVAGGDYDALLARFSADGSLDATFGSSGVVIDDWTPAADDYVGDVLVQADGKIVVAGTAGEEAFAVARYLADGTPDPAFGTGGLAVTDFGDDSYAAATAVIVQPDGMIVAAGWGFPAGSVDFLLARYTTSGGLDGDFGTAGLVVTDFSGSGSYDAASGVALTAGGEIVVIGLSDAIEAWRSRIALARYDADGGLDPDFGTGGLVADGFPAPSAGRDVAIQPDGMILVAGEFGSLPDRDFALARYEADGSPDTSFGYDGARAVDFETVDTATDVGLAMVLQPDGRIVVAGSSHWFDPSPPTNRWDLALARFLPGGALDPTFGQGGKVILDLHGAHGKDSGHGLVAQPDGRLVAAGWADAPAETYDLAMARLLSSTELIFSDGFESGSLASWSDSTGGP